MSSGLMNTSPGGESDQYESIKTVTNPHSKESGQLGDRDLGTQVDTVDSQQTQQKAEKGAKIAENVRYGQTISEGGMSGQTTEMVGNACQGFGGNNAEMNDFHAKESRQDQGYGPGPDIGA